MLNKQTVPKLSVLKPTISYYFSCLWKKGDEYSDPGSAGMAVLCMSLILLGAAQVQSPHSDG